MGKKWSELSGQERMAAIGGVLVLVASVLPWYSISGFGVSGFESGFLGIGGILLSVAGSYILLSEPLFGTRVTFGQLQPSQTALLVSVAGTTLLALRLLTWISFVGIGVFLALGGSGLVVYGSLRMLRSKELSIPFVSSDPPASKEEG